MSDAARAAEYRRYATQIDADVALLTPVDQRAAERLARAARLLRAHADVLDPTTPEQPR